MIPEDDFRLIFLWATPTTHRCPFYTVLLYCVITGAEYPDSSSNDESAEVSINSTNNVC